MSIRPSFRLALVALVVGLTSVVTPGPAAAFPDCATTQAVPSTVDTQYSDGVDITFSVSCAIATPTAQATGLPGGLVLTATPDSSQPNTVSFSVTGAVTADVGSYPVTFTVDDLVPDSFGTTIEVAPEDASATYTGDTAVEAPISGPDAVEVTLGAHVAELLDGTTGDLTLATVTIRDLLLDETLCTDLPVDSSGDASCTYAADLPSNAGRTYDLAVLVGGRFVGTGSGTLVVTVDHTPPDTAIISGPPDGSLLLGTSETFGFISSESPVTFGCRLDGASAPCAAAPLHVSGLSRRTHTVSVNATDRAGNSDPTPATRTFTVPLDDTDLNVRSGVWLLRSSGAAYQRTYLQARQKGARLTERVSGVTSLTLLVGRGPTFGKLKVYLNGTLLKKIRLKGPPGLSQPVRVASFTTPRSGKVTIRSVNKQRVTVDGLAVSTGG